MPNLEWIDWARLPGLLLLPGCILLASLAAGISLNKVVSRHVDRRFTDVTDDSVKGVFLNAMRGLPISFCLAMGLYWIVNTNDELPAGVVKIFSYVLFAVIVFTVTHVLERTISGLVDIRLSGSDNASQSTLLDTILKVVIYSMGILVILQYYGISIAPIITAMGVGGMAVALGMQETLANIFSGLQLILSKQLRIGEYIRLSTGDEGRVTDINWRFTTITPVTNANAVVIPNKTIAGSITTNYSRPKDDFVIKIPVGVSYDSDLQHVERVTLEVAAKVMSQVDGYEPARDANGIDRNPMAPSVRFHTFGDSSIDFNVFLRTSMPDNQFLLKHEFIKALTARYRKEGIDIPFPIRTLVQQPRREM